jgi:hypothetical protein
VVRTDWETGVGEMKPEVRMKQKKFFYVTALIIFYVINFLVFISPAFAQNSLPPEILWTKTYGGIYDDWGYSIQQTFDGGYIICGMYGNQDSSDVYLIKTDAYGDTVWVKSYGGSLNDEGHSVHQTSDGGYIITGSTSSFGAGEKDVYLIKTDSLGDTLWTRTFGDVDDDEGYEVQQTSDGGYIITGYTKPIETRAREEDPADVYIVKTDGNGIMLWRKNYGGLYGDWGRSVQQTVDGGYIIAGYTLSFTKLGRASYHDIYLLKTDSLGDTLWTNHYGGGRDDRGYSICQTTDGGYIITGFTTEHDSADLCLLKTDANGNEGWYNAYGPAGIASKKDYGYSVLQTSDGGYIACGKMKDDVYLIRTNSFGDSLWTHTYEDAGDNGGYQIYQTSDGGYIITGYTDSLTAGGYDVYVIKTKPVVMLVSPVGGEVWQGGSEQLIEWYSENPSDNTHHWRIVFSQDSGQTFPDTIADDLSADTRSFNWTVPLIDCAYCRIKLEFINDFGDIIADDLSDQIFTIDMTAPVIDSTTVWGDTTYSGPFEILTKVSDNCAGVDSVMLYYKRDQDLDWIAVAMHDTGFPLWYVDSIPSVSNPGDSVRYYIEAIDGAGHSATDPSDAPGDYYAFRVGTTGIAEHGVIPALFSFGLHSNPIIGHAVFYMTLPMDTYLTLNIYDVTGRLIAQPLMGTKSAGYHEVMWETKVSSGVYFYMLDSAWQREKGKLVLLR